MQCSLNDPRGSIVINNKSITQLSKKREKTREGNVYGVKALCRDCCWFQATVSEERRLAATVHQIDEDASVVPRGAFVKSPRGLVHVNRSFAGKYTSACVNVKNLS